MATTGTVRTMNLKRIRDYARRQSEMRIAETARDTGLSIPTVSRMIGDLLASGELLESGSRASTGGRRAAVYKVNPMYLTYLLVRVEADTLTWQLRDYAGGCAESGEAEVRCGMVSELDRLLIDTRLRYPMLKAAYLGVAGMVSNGKIVRMTRKHELQGLDVPEHFARTMLEASLSDMPVFVENDTNLVASGRWSRLGLSKGAIVCLYGTGVGAGAGLMIDGRLWRGRNGLPGELGFFPALHRMRGFAPGEPTELFSEMTIQYAHDEQKLREATLEFFTQVVCMYAAVVDPDLIVIYGEKLNGMLSMDALRARCGTLLPDGCVPRLAYSDEWDSDYLLGMDNETRARLGIQ